MYGVDGDTGKMVDMKEYGLLESASVKIQTLKTAIEVRFHLHLYPHVSPSSIHLYLHPSRIAICPIPVHVLFSSISYLYPSLLSIHLLAPSIPYPIHLITHRHPSPATTPIRPVFPSISKY
jgi:hypothetical protein